MDGTDKQWIRGGTTALAAIVVGSLLFIIGLEFIEAFCAGDCDFGAISMVGIAAFWGALGAFTAGQAAWHRDASHGTILAATLAWVALHFASPRGAWRLYQTPLQWLEDASDAVLASTIPGFLFYWLLAATVGILCAWWMPRFIEGRIEHHFG